jgi:hypothetical protein
MSKLIIIQAVVFFLFLATAAVGFSDENKSEKIKSQLITEHNNKIKRVKRELPFLLKGLEDESENRRSSSALRLRFAEVCEAVSPLIQTAKKDISPDVRATAINSLLFIAYKGDSIPDFNKYLERDIIPLLKHAIKDKNETVVKSAAIALYRLGEKDTAWPVVEALIASGDYSILNVFVYLPAFSKNDLLVDVALPEQLSDPLTRQKKALDEDAEPFLLRLLDSEVNGKVKLYAMQMIFEFDVIERNHLVVYLLDIADDFSVSIDGRKKALSLMYEIGTSESKKALYEALEIEGLQDYASHYLTYWDKKRRN